ncbi:protein winged eye isoform X2 [Anoplophora glabripennis]|uniref:protein winged eye isoform X2 n=1 Tax=Anoplophora glabripennis TaxID=217634 RepID=UPI000873DB06|nr:protein winged eye isoform X2 [Anoplophora glabripennis]
MLGSPAGPGGPSQRGLWPLAPAPAPTATSFSADGLGKYGVYSLFPGGPSFGSALYSHASTLGRFASGQLQQSSGNTFHAAHKVSDSLFSTSGYTFGAPTPPPGSPYSPIPVTQLELLTKGFNSNIIIQQPDYPPSPKKAQEKLCDDKCCSLKPQKACSCQLGSPVKASKYSDAINGCSRTNPIEWSGVNVKKEPGACQVAEISTSASPMVKLEVTSPTQKNGDNGMMSNSIISTNGGNIPVGIAIARQRVQQEVIASPSLPPSGLLTTFNGGAQIKEITRISEIDPSGATGSMAASSAMGGQQGGTLLQCTDDRGAGLAAWQMGGGHSQALATPTLWQYPAPVPVEPMVPLPVPMPPVGFQLVRDPTTGGLLLLPTAGIEPLQQAVVWPSYSQPSSVLLPSLPPMPPPPLQLLSSASSDYLSSSTTLHQHTQTHSTRLVAVTTDTKRKIPMPIPATTLIKIETDATLDQTKTLQAVSTIASNTGTVFTDQNMAPLVTTHVIYQHPTNLILSQTPNGEASCRSQATSPVACLTPPPETQTHEEEASTVQDASNQTDTPFCSEDDNTTHTMSDVVGETKSRLEHVLEKPIMEMPHDYSVTKTLVPEMMEVIQEPPKLDEIEEAVQPSIPMEEEEPEQEVVRGVEETMSPQKPDLSGLELLSNSIVEFENCRNKTDEELQVSRTCESPKIRSSTPLPISNETEVRKEPVIPQPPVDDSLGGLGLLCALAEQRILEENEKPKVEKEKSKERKKEKRKSKKHSSDEPKRKKLKSDKHHEDREHKRKEKSYEKNNTDKEKTRCACHEENYRTYKTPESEEEVKKFIASKSQPICCKGDWPCMNAMELDMRMKLAELQRQYREKQKELSKLKPKRHSTDCSKKRSRKKSTHSSHSDRSSTPPPLLDKMDVPVKPNRDKSELLKPPTLCAMPKLDEIYKTNQSDVDSSPEKYSSSKKRKVGRPKKLMSSSGEHVATETIVAKKPKSSFVGYLLAAKEKFKMQNKTYPDATPPRYVEETITIKPKKNKNNNHIIATDVKSSKIRPKLRAEATIKTYADDDRNEWETIAEEEEGEDEEQEHVEELADEESEVEEEERVEETVPETTHQEEEEEEESVAEEEIVEEVKPEDTRCTLTAELLEVDKLRVLTAMGGLFYAGQLNALEPPDVYSIILDGERGNRPHIMSREEILRDAIVEVAPKNTDDLPVGTRLCAYWSQQYRCLYPGSVAEPGTPDPQLDGKFVSVEFDDGDSGRIALEDIRLLPPDYPIIEYDPNPLLSLCKRRRRTSTSVSTEDKTKTQINVALPQVESQKPPKDLEVEKENKDVNKPSREQHKEKKRLKKKKREKLRQKLMHEDKKKKKKHKCNDENCKHKKHHKKHRKHKKHHDKVRNEPVEQNEVEEVEEVEDVVEELSSEQNEEVEEVIEDYEIVANPEDEVTMDDIIKATKSKKSKKIRDRQESCESRSKMSAFLPARQLWGWAGKGYKRQRAKGRSKKSFYKSIQRGKETITVGDSAVFLSTGRPDRPYIGRIEAMWELCGTMVVKVKWFYHPEETVGCPQNLQYPGALFESPHVDENDVQTISHKCEVLPLKEYTERLGDDPQRYATIYDNNDIYYLAGYYDPTTHTIKMEPGIPFTKTN